MTGINAYQKHQIMSFEKENKAYWVHLLNQKISLLLNEAADHMKNKNHQEKNIALQKAQEIIEIGLMNHLDKSNSVGESLDLFYSLSLLNMTKANLNQSVKDLESIADSYKELSQSWLEISKKENV